MDVYALFTDCTSEMIMMDSFPKNEDEKGLIIRTTISSQNLKESAITSVENTFILLNKHLKAMPKDITLCIYGFSNKVTGNSADLAFAIAFAGFLVENKQIELDHKVSNRIAATGMIDERLNIRSIKGIKAKFLAALEKEAEVIYFPYENLKDLEEIKNGDEEFNKLLDKVRIVPVSSLKETFIDLGIISYDDSLMQKESSNIKRRIKRRELRYSVFAIIIALGIGIGGFAVLNNLLKNNRDINTSQKDKTFMTSGNINGSNIDLKENLSDNTKDLPKNYNSPMLGSEEDLEKTENNDGIENNRKKETSSGALDKTTPVENTLDKLKTNTAYLEKTNVKKNTEPTRVATEHQKGSEKSTPEKLQNTKSGRVEETPAKVSQIDVVNYSGNLTTNIANSGFVSSQEDYIYYSSNLDVGIYKIKGDGSQKTKLISDLATCINVVGDYIYYIKKKDNSICRIKRDGSGFRRLIDDEAESINVIGDWIYYLCITDKKIYKVKKNGFDRTPLCRELSNGECKNLNVINNNIYYSFEYGGNSSEDGIYKMKTDGSDKVLITKNKCSFFTLDESNIYYISSNDSMLYKLSLNQNNSDKFINLYVNSFASTGGWIYYSNREGIFKIHSNGDLSIKVSSDPGEKINIIGDWIYYYNSNDGNRMYRVRTNGKDKKAFE